MKIEKLRAKLAKYEAIYRETQQQLRDAYRGEIESLDFDALKTERRVHKGKGKSEGNKRSPKVTSTARSAMAKSAITGMGKRRPGRPRMTEAQKAEAREMRRQKLATVSDEGAMVAMDEAVYMAQPVHE